MEVDERISSGGKEEKEEEGDWYQVNATIGWVFTLCCNGEGLYTATMGRVCTLCNHGEGLYTVQQWGRSL